MARINTNIPSMIAQSNLSRTQDDMATRLMRLSTGLRINQAGDVAAFDGAGQCEAVGRCLNERCILLGFHASELVVQVGDVELQLPVMLLIQLEEDMEQGHRVRSARYADDDPVVRSKQRGT